MTFIETVPEDQATGPAAAMYEADREALGFLPNFTKAFSLRPDVYAAWRRLNEAIKGNMDLRRYELATVAAARRLRSSYCALAHGSVLLDKFLDAETVRAVVSDHAAAARCFFSKTLDGLGVQADAKYTQLDPELRDALTVGRAIAEAS